MDQSVVMGTPNLSVSEENSMSLKFLLSALVKTQNDMSVEVSPQSRVSLSWRF
jgi:hypothetical protein